MWWCWWLTGWLRLYHALPLAKKALRRSDRAFHEVGDFGRELDTNDDAEHRWQYAEQDNVMSSYTLHHLAMSIF